MKTGSRKFKALPGNQHKKKRCKRTRRTPMKKESAGTTMTKSSGTKTNKKSGPLAVKYGDHNCKDREDGKKGKKQNIGKKAARKICKSTKKKKRISYSTEENVIKITSQICAPI